MKVSNRKNWKSAQQPEAGVVLPSGLRSLSHEMRGRLIAQAFVANGGNTKDAIRTATTVKNPTGSIDHFPAAVQKAFYEELDRLLAKADINKDAALRSLWTMVNVSALDFLGNDGLPLSVAELRKLPREVQNVIDRIEVVRALKPVRGDDGEYLFDPNTHRPILRPSVTCRIKMPEKTKAITALAQILKWIDTGTHLTVNIAQIMKQSDERANNMRVQATIDTLPALAQAAGARAGDVPNDREPPRDADSTGVVEV